MYRAPSIRALCSITDVSYVVGSACYSITCLILLYYVKWCYSINIMATRFSIHEMSSRFIQMSLIIRTLFIGTIPTTV